MKFAAWPFLILLFCCSEEKEINQSTKRDGSPPFPLVRNLELSKEQIKKLENEEFKSKFSRINPGDFMMGSPENEKGREDEETLHKVLLTDPFYMSKFETTIKDWNAVYVSGKRNPTFHIQEQEKIIIVGIHKNFSPLGSYQEKITPSLKEKFSSLEKEVNQISTISLQQIEYLWSHWSTTSKDMQKKIASKLSFDVKEITQKIGDIVRRQIQMPVTQVSYTQAVAFCHQLTENAYRKGDLPKGMIYRLPTEAEWEYACRAGMNGVSGLGDGESLSGLNANLDGSRRDLIIGRDATLINRGNLIPVGAKLTRFKPNKWGLYDMHGSVMEWCYDFYGDYENQDVTNPIGPVKGNTRVLRGGSFYRSAYGCRSAKRYKLDPSWRGSEIGFRVVLGFKLR